MQTERLKFGGSASEYFRIWIVNLLLSIVTLGIYSAWAKVRRKKYFYRNTTLDGHNFDYHANPVAILKGRLIAVPVLGLYIGSGYVSLIAQVVIIVLIGLALPWLIVRSQIFNRRNTTYRNVRFDFAPRFREAYRVVGTRLLLAVVTVGLAYPLFDYKLRDFIIKNSSFGKTNFQFSGAPGKFFKVYYAAYLVTVVAYILAIFVVIRLMTSPMFSQQEQSGGSNPPIILLTFLFTILLLVLGLLVSAYIRARLANYVYSRTAMEDNTLSCSFRARDLGWIYITNVIAIVLSVGFLIPWATVRLTRYQLERINLTIPESLDGFVGKSAHAESATGEELADVFDIGFGL